MTNFFKFKAIKRFPGNLAASLIIILELMEKNLFKLFRGHEKSFFPSSKSNYEIDLWFHERRAIFIIPVIYKRAFFFETANAIISDLDILIFNRQ